jgi:hypothetical protein
MSETSRLCGTEYTLATSGGIAILRKRLAAHADKDDIHYTSAVAGSRIFNLLPSSKRILVYQLKLLRYFHQLKHNIRYGLVARIHRSHYDCSDVARVRFPVSETVFFLRCCCSGGNVKPRCRVVEIW